MHLGLIPLLAAVRMQPASFCSHEKSPSRINTGVRRTRTENVEHHQIFAMHYAPTFIDLAFDPIMFALYLLAG